MPAAAADPDKNMVGMLHSGGLAQLIPTFTMVSAAINPMTCVCQLQLRDQLLRLNMREQHAMYVHWCGQSVETKNHGNDRNDWWNGI